MRAVAPVQLSVLLGIQLYRAAADLPTAEPRALWERFLAWTRRRPGPRG